MHSSKNAVNTGISDTRQRGEKNLETERSCISAPLTDSDIALGIGKLCLENPGVVDDLAMLVTKDKCTSGMRAYLHVYKEGILPRLAQDVDDGGQFMNRLKKSFSVDAANWAWNVDTANQKIDEVILEYQIIAESNKLLSRNISFDDTIREWLDKCDMIRISYLYAKNYWGDLSDFMGLLYEMKKSENLPDSKREKFLEQIRTHGEAFIHFYGNQVDLFKRACEFMVRQFSDDEVRSIFKLLPGNCFTAEKGDYQRLVQAAVDKYVSEQGTTKLKELWYQKTFTETPRRWSKKYKMPILCMIPDEDMIDAREAFDTLNSKKPDKSAIEKATEFLEKADFYDKLDSEEERDKAFRDTIIKSYDVMLDDVEEVKDYLMRATHSDPYDWLGLPEVEKELRKMAEFKYNESGCERALEKIDSMGMADVKRYLKQLIKDNMVVGMEIIKGK